MSKITQMWKEQNGVSPVIGVVLLVAITVILAAVVGVLAFGLDNNQNASPSVAMESSAQGQTVEFTVSSGDNFDPSTATLKIDVTVKNPKSGNSKTTSLSSPLDNDTSKSLTITDASGNDENVDVKFVSLDSDDVTAGDSFSVNLDSSRSNSNLVIANYDAKVVRQTGGGSSSSVLFSDKGSASASSGGGSSTSLSSSVSRVTTNYNASMETYGIAYGIGEDVPVKSSDTKIEAPVTVDNQTTGGGKDTFTYDSSDLGISDMTESGASPGTGDSSNLKPRAAYNPNGLNDGTFDKNDVFAVQFGEVSDTYNHEVEDFTIKVIEKGSGDVLYKNSK